MFARIVNLCVPVALETVVATVASEAVAAVMSVPFPVVPAPIRTAEY